MASCIECHNEVACYCPDCYYDAHERARALGEQVSLLRSHVSYLEMKLEDVGVPFGCWSAVSAGLFVSAVGIQPSPGHAEEYSPWTISPLLL